MKNSIFLICIGVTHWVICQFAYASPARSLSIVCPSIIANKSNGSIIFDRAAGNKNLQCFKSYRDAKKSGYIPKVEFKELDFSGWWRVKYTKISDSCGKYPSKSDLVLFVQILQQKDGTVFTDFCPSTGRQVGVKTSTGITVSRTEILNEGSSFLSCPSAMVELTEHLEIERVIDGAATYSSKLTRIYRCPGSEEGSMTCSTIFQGRALPETHKIWPSVESNTSKMENSCNKALGKCAECHENLGDPAIIR